MTLTDSASVTTRGRAACIDGEGEPTVVWLRGEQDASTLEELSRTLATAMALEDVDLLVDVSGVQFMGAAPVGVFGQARELLRLRSRSLGFRSPSTCVRRVLDLCGLTDLVDGP